MSLMILSADSYSGDDILYSTVCGKLRNKKFYIKVKLYEELMELASKHIPKDIYQIRFLHDLRFAINDYTVRYVTNNNCCYRQFRSVVNVDRDLYFPIDMMGLTNYSKEYTVLFSLKDSLDLVLNHICGVPIDAVRNIPDYKLISRAILSLDFDLLGKRKFSIFFDVHPKLDTFLIQLYSTSSSVEDFEYRFLSFILTTTNNLLHDFACKYRSILKDHGIICVLRSYDFNSVSFTSDTKIEEDLFEIADKYFLIVKGYTKGDFVNHVGLDCSNYLGGVSDDTSRGN